MVVALELLARPAPRPDLFEQLIVPVRLPGGPAAASLLDDVSSRMPPGVPAAAWHAEPTPQWVTDTVRAGRGAEVDLWALAARDAADVLIAATHAGVGFGPGLQPRAAAAAEVWTLLDAAVCALTGEDVLRAWQASGAGSGARPHGPQRQRCAAIAGLPRAAREAVRDVITCIRVPAADCARVDAELAAVAAVRGAQ